MKKRETIVIVTRVRIESLPGYRDLPVRQYKLGPRNLLLAIQGLQEERRADAHAWLEIKGQQIDESTLRSVAANDPYPRIAAGSPLRRKSPTDKSRALLAEIASGEFTYKFFRMGD